MASRTLSDPGKSVYLSVEIECPSSQAARRLVDNRRSLTGVWEGAVPAVRAPHFTDFGGYFHGTNRPRWNVGFIYPPHGVRELARLQGKLEVRPGLRSYELKIQPDSQGQTLRQRDLSVTVEKWSQTGDLLSVVLRLASPMLAKLAPRRSFWGYQASARLLEAPSRSGWPANARTTSTPDGVRQEYGFTHVTTPDGLALTVETHDGRVCSLPFALTDIPVPRVDMPAPPASSIGMAARAGSIHSAPWLGDDPITIHFRGTLGDAVAALKRRGQMEILGPHRQVGPNRQAPFALDLPVRLDLDRGSLHQALFSLCRQAGLVYRVDPDTDQVALRPGDVSRDPRPIARLGEYRVHVNDVSRSWSRWYDWYPGHRVAATTSAVERLSLGLEVEARSRAAALRVGGLAPTFRVTPDTGPAFVVEVPDLKRSRLSFSGEHRSPPGSRGGTVAETGIEVTCPPPEVRALKRLEGGLWLCRPADRVVPFVIENIPLA